MLRLVTRRSEDGAAKTVRAVFLCLERALTAICMSLLDCFVERSILDTFDIEANDAGLLQYTPAIVAGVYVTG